LDDIPDHFKPLLSSAATATVPRTANNTNLSHDPFRFEWGTWANQDAIEVLMERANEIRCQPGVFDVLVDKYAPMTKVVSENKDNDNEKEKDATATTAPINKARRLRLAGGQDWDIFLHVLPQASFWRGRWPTGSWSILKPLIGVTEVAMLRESNLNKKATTKDLRGGSDASRLGGGMSTSGGDDCVKYVGGPIRSYTGKSGKTILLEVIIRPPIGKLDYMAAMGEDQMEELVDDWNDILAVYITPVVEEEEEEEEEEEKDFKAAATGKKENESRTTASKTTMTKSEASTNGNVGPPSSSSYTSLPSKSTMSTTTVTATTTEESEGSSNNNLGAAMGMTFEKVGGLDAQLDAIARRVLASRANPAAARRLGVSHVRGVLLSGPPGCTYIISSYVFFLMRLASMSCLFVDLNECPHKPQSLLYTQAERHC